MNKKPLLEFDVQPNAIRRGDDGRLRFEGVAMFENAMSGNRRFFPASFIDESIKHTEEWLQLGHVTTIHRTHEAWMFGELPIGKVENLRHQDKAMAFDAQISKTSVGTDMMALVEDGVMARMSLRSTQYVDTWEHMEVEGQDEPVQVQVMQWAVIEGIDFCERPGITGAGITQILEETPKWSKEKNMEWSDITLEELRANRPDLLEGYRTEMLGAFLTERDEVRAEAVTANERVAELEATIAELEAVDDKTEEVEALTEQLEALMSERGEFEWRLQRFEEAAPRWLVGLVEELEDVEPDALAEAVVEKRDEIIASFTAAPEPKGKGESLEDDRPVVQEDEANPDLSLKIVKNTR